MVDGQAGSAKGSEGRAGPSEGDLSFALAERVEAGDLKGALRVARIGGDPFFALSEGGGKSAMDAMIRLGQGLATGTGRVNGIGADEFSKAFAEFAGRWNGRGNVCVVPWDVFLFALRDEDAIAASGCAGVSFDFKGWRPAEGKGRQEGAGHPLVRLAGAAVTLLGKSKTVSTNPLVMDDSSRAEVSEWFGQRMGTILTMDSSLAGSVIKTTMVMPRESMFGERLEVEKPLCSYLAELLLSSGAWSEPSFAGTSMAVAAKLEKWRENVFLIANELVQRAANALCEAGADMSATDRFGNDVSKAAAGSLLCSGQTLALLASLGADPETPNNYGNNVFDVLSLTLERAVEAKAGKPHANCSGFGVERRMLEAESLEAMAQQGIMSRLKPAGKRARKAPAV